MATISNKVLMSWSGGKDSSLALYEVLGEGELDVHALITTAAKTASITPSSTMALYSDSRSPSSGARWSCAKTASSISTSP